MRRAGLVTLLALATGCSALINPDADRLGEGIDAGPTETDGGRADAGPDFDGGPGFDAGGPGDDAGPGCAMGCDDSIACTDDACVAGRCTHEPSDGACPSDQRCSPTLGCVPMRCSSDAECDDAQFCNGAERCDSGAMGTGCVAGTPPACADPYACTEDRCDEGSDRCVSTPDDAMCDSGAAGCASERCDPSASDEPSGCFVELDNEACNTNYCRVGRLCRAVGGCSGGTVRDCSDGSVCTVDACDAAAETCTSTPLDVDMDGFAARLVLDSDGSLVICEGATDCDDDNPDVRPDAVELCNGFDDNCNDMVDEGCTGLPDDCGSAEEIRIGSGGTGNVRGSLDMLGDDYQTNPICRARTGGRDAVYFFDLPRGLYDVTIDTIGSTADTVLGVGFSCDASGLAAACDDDYDLSLGRDSRIWLHRVGSATATTRIYVLVDGFQSTTTGDYVVNVTRQSATGDNCPGALGGRPLDITGGGTVLGFSNGFVGTESGSCNASGPINDPEAVLQFRGPSAGNVNFSAFSVEFTPDIYLREGCSGGTELACSAGASVGGGVNGATLSSAVTSGTTYSLFVDGGRGAYAVYYTPR